MSRLLAGALRRASAGFFEPELLPNSKSFRPCIKCSAVYLREFAARAKGRTKSRGKGISKSNGIDNDEQNLSAKDIALNQALDQITSSFGKGAIMWLGRQNGLRDVPVVSTGSLTLDCALGIGGLPRGRVVEIYGPEASGKTTLALHVIAEAQKKGGYCAFIDAEHALDPALAESIGVKTDSLLFSQPDCGEQALNLVDTLIRSGSVDVVVVDSVASLVPKSELDGEVGDSHVALQARLMSQALRKLSHSLSLSKTILLFINQVRAKVQTFGFGGPTEVTCGGYALKFYSSVRLEIRRIGFVRKNEQSSVPPVGSLVSVKIVKNKHAPPFKTAQFEIEFGKGICRNAEMIELACKHGYIQRTASHYRYNGCTFHGRDSLMQHFSQNEDIRDELMVKLRETLIPGEMMDRGDSKCGCSEDSSSELSWEESASEAAAAWDTNGEGDAVTPGVTPETTDEEMFATAER